MQLWRYLVEQGQDLTTEEEKELLEYCGVDGWELVAVTEDQGFTRFYMKRPVDHLKEHK